MTRTEVCRAVLSTNLPGDSETLLLRACLLDGENGRRAWTSLAGAGVDVSHLLTHGGHGVRRLAPLLYEALRRHGLEADPELLTRCRMASMREELRAGAFDRVAGGVFDALEDAGVPFIVLKGAALAKPVYGNSVLRHSHDLELLLPEAEAPRAASALRTTGCEGTEPLRAGGKLRVFHESGLPVILRTRLFEPELYGGDWEWCSERTATVSVADRKVRTLSPGVALHHVCVHATYGHGRSSLQWVADAIMLTRRGVDPRSDLYLDWRDVTACVERSRTGLPLATVLGYLQRELGAGIPTRVTQAVERAAAEASGLEREVALRCVWWGRPKDFSRALRARIGWLDRVRLAWRIFAPSPAYAAYRLGTTPSLGALTAYYARRATRHTTRVVASSLQ